jgi:hypothetical protein
MYIAALFMIVVAFIWRTYDVLVYRENTAVAIMHGWRSIVPLILIGLGALIAVGRGIYYHESNVIFIQMGIGIALAFVAIVVPELLIRRNSPDFRAGK